MNKEAGDGEILAWGVVANVSREVFVRHGGGTKERGLKHFSPGARVWVLPTMWGDGGEKRYVVGMRRNSGGRTLIRIAVRSDHLVNFRGRSVRSPAVYRAMTDGWPDEWYNNAVLGTRGLWNSDVEAKSCAAVRKYDATRAVHLQGAWWGEMHRADEECEFCDGRDAYLDGRPVSENPHTDDVDVEIAAAGNEVRATLRRMRRTVEPPGWESQRDLWTAGWRSEAMLVERTRDRDRTIRALTERRARMRERARAEATSIVGQTLKALEHRTSRGDDPVPVRFLRGDYQPRRLDGVVHAWLNDADVVERTQYG